MMSVILVFLTIFLTSFKAFAVIETGSGNQQKYYKYEKNDFGVNVLVETTKENADVIANYNSINTSSTQMEIPQNETIEKIDTTFENITSTDSSYTKGSILENYGTIQNITSDFVNNTLNFSTNSTLYGGILGNNGEIGNVSGNYIGNSLTNGGKLWGSVIFTWPETSDTAGNISGINGNFIANTTTSTKSYAIGTIVTGAKHDFISGNFIGNTIYAQSNTVAGGGVVVYGGNVNNISGLFSGNSIFSETSLAQGGAICNNSGIIGSINAIFENNTAYSNNNARGGAIDNYGKISLENDEGGITNSSFTNNMAYSKTGTAQGGAIYSSNNISKIEADFNRNLAQSNAQDPDVIRARGGAINNTGTISQNITGNFNQNKVYAPNASAAGGAIYNTGTIGSITNSNFTNNTAQSDNGNSYAGAIYTTKDLNIIADNATSVFSGNYIQNKETKEKEYQAIYVADSNAILNLTTKNNGIIEFDDSIDGVKDYKVAINGDNTGTIKLRNNINNAQVTIQNTNLDIEQQKVSMSKATFDSSSTLSLNIDSKQDYGQLYAKDYLKIEEGAILNVTLSQNAIKTMNNEEIQLLASDNEFTDNFSNTFSNLMYSFNKKENKQGYYILTQINTAEDIYNQNKNSNNIKNSAAAWLDSKNFSSNEKSQNIADRLSELAQHDGKEFSKQLKNLAPTTASIITITAKEEANIIFNKISNQLNNTKDETKEGISSGDNITNKTSAWIETISNTAKFDNNNIDTFKSNTYGIAMGIEKEISPKTKIGMGYAKSDGNIDISNKDIDTNSNTFFTYGRYTKDNHFIDLMGALSFTDYDETKFALNNAYNATYDTKTISLKSVLGYNFNFDETILTPTIDIRYYNIYRDSYQDTATQYIASNTEDLLTLALGINLKTELHSPKDNIIKLSSYANLTYDVTPTQDNSTIFLTNGSSYIVKGEKLDRAGVEFGANIYYDVNKKLEITAGYNGVLKNNYQNHTGTLSGRYKF